MVPGMSLILLNETHGVHVTYWANGKSFQASHDYTSYVSQLHKTDVCFSPQIVCIISSNTVKVGMELSGKSHIDFCMFCSLNL